jgi:hypothetical protein
MALTIPISINFATDKIANTNKTSVHESVQER